LARGDENRKKQIREKGKRRNSKAESNKSITKEAGRQEEQGDTKQNTGNKIKRKFAPFKNSEKGKKCYVQLITGHEAP
jgi:hypothetical protein